MSKAKTRVDSMSFVGVASLPVVGDAHPLRRRYRRFVTSAIVIAALIHLGAGMVWVVQRHLKSTDDRSREVKIVRYTELGVPPSIAQQQQASAQVAIAQQVAPPSLGIPEPVPDFQATVTDFATQDQLAEMLTPTDLSDLSGAGGDSLVIDIPQASGNDNPDPDEFVAVEEMPVLIDIPAPVYPDMARQAEVEGTVMVRALVGKDGKVQDAFVTEGIPMLNDAAIVAAKKAVFKPALQQHKPVAVWVQIPMRFTLN
ncbi:MAG: TonB family protein [Candidatus Eisenbacteria bacterium]|nr:TonB family protein [Candidatus Latescibacterota bacterium]MBD3301620.1 TonB family protein [Candidatus Eisenbacteria bacterium]